MVCVLYESLQTLPVTKFSEVVNPTSCKILALNESYTQDKMRSLGKKKRD